MITDKDFNNILYLLNSLKDTYHDKNIRLYYKGIVVKHIDIDQNRIYLEDGDILHKYHFYKTSTVMENFTIDISPEQLILSVKNNNKFNKTRTIFNKYGIKITEEMWNKLW